IADFDQAKIIKIAFDEITGEIVINGRPIEQTLLGESAAQQKVTKLLTLPQISGRAHRFETSLVSPPHDLRRETGRKGRPRDRAVPSAGEPGPARDRKAVFDHRLA